MEERSRGDGDSQPRRRFPYSRAWTRAGFSPVDAEAWRQAGWTDPDEAAAWRAIGGDSSPEQMLSLARGRRRGDDLEIDLRDQVRANLFRDAPAGGRGRIRADRR
jgi:hypothetical protein